MSEEDELYIKVIVLNEIYNRIVKKNLKFDISLDVQIFSYEICYLTNYIWFLKFKIWIFENILDGETPETKVIDLKKLCKFVVDSFFIWNYLLPQNGIWS
jgi:hypothetical protein